MSDTLLQNMRTHLLRDADLLALISDRLYPDAAPHASTPFPYIVYFEVSFSTDHSLAGPTGLREVRIQFDVYSKAKKEAHDIRERILAVWDGYRGDPVFNGVKILCVEVANQRTGYEHDERVYSYSLDLNFHYLVRASA